MRARRRPSLPWLIAAASAGFAAGVLLMSAPARRPATARAPARALVAPAPRATATPAIGADPVEELKRRHLALPVSGVRRDELRDTFDDLRAGSRRHEALDILAPRHTPVRAVEDGTVAKLFRSDAGGLTIYQFDPSASYAYYYAHLERYAEGLKEGDTVTTGQVLGYVGTSGNAPEDTPHLHFAIFRLTHEKRWWEGTAIDPYPILRR